MKCRGRILLRRKWQVSNGNIFLKTHYKKQFNELWMILALCVSLMACNISSVRGNNAAMTLVLKMWPIVITSSFGHPTWFLSNHGRISFYKMTSAVLLAVIRGQGRKKWSLEVATIRKSNACAIGYVDNVEFSWRSTDFKKKSNCLVGTSSIMTNTSWPSIQVTLILTILLFSPIVHSSTCCVTLADNGSPLFETRWGAASISRTWINSSRNVVRRN